MYSIFIRRNIQKWALTIRIVLTSLFTVDYHSCPVSLTSWTRMVFFIKVQNELLIINLVYNSKMFYLTIYQQYNT